MAKKDEGLSKYFAIAKKLRSNGKVPTSDIKYFIEYSNEIDQDKLQKIVDSGEASSFEEAQAALLEAGQALQTSPDYKEQTLQFAQDAEKGRMSEKLAQGIDLILKGTDIATSISQIRESKNQLAKSVRPQRPTVPGRDPYLQQALRQSQESTGDAGRALAPVQAQIADQYNADIANAKTASTGQSGAFGAYGQLAANRRNRSAMQLAPIQDEIRRGQQARTDELIGMRMGETQNQFQNAASLYPTDLNQYQAEQEAAGRLGATGRANLRDSLYGLGQSVVAPAADYIAERKYRRLKDQAATMYGDEIANTMVQADKGINNYWANSGQGMYEDIWKAYGNR